MIVAYPQVGKARSLEVLKAYIAGCGGRISGQTLSLEAGGAAFYGTIGLQHLVRLAIDERREWRFGDNAFFDAHRGRFFRFGRNAFQEYRIGTPDHDRRKRLAIEPRPWRNGSKIVVVEQSDHHLELTGAPRRWAVRVVADLRQHTDREIVLRRWRRDKARAAATLGEDLRDAWALVTHTSAAANEAIIAGVPVFVSGLCAATPMASGALSSIEKPRRPENREDWAGWLVANQWTLEELRAGAAARLHEEKQ